MYVEPRLRAFAAVARTGSLTRAAEELFLSQPAISKHVAALEKDIGRPLLVRRARGVDLTPTGQTLADYVLRAEALLANATRSMRSEGKLEIGTLAVAASGIPGTYLLPQVLAQFRRDYPGVDVEFELTTSGSALELVRRHQSELAVVGGMTVPPEMESEPLVADDVVLIGPHALANRQLRAKELEEFTWISREEGSSTRAAVEAARWQIGLHPVRTLELPSWEAVKIAVAQGDGIAACSMFALRLELKTKSIAVLNVPRWRLSRTIAAVRARGIPLTPPAEEFLSRLREVLPRGEAGTARTSRRGQHATR